MQYGSNEYLGLTKSTEATTEIKGLIGSLPNATWLVLPMQALAAQALRIQGAFVWFLLPHSQVGPSK